MNINLHILGQMVFLWGMSPGHGENPQTAKLAHKGASRSYTKGLSEAESRKHQGQEAVLQFKDEKSGKGAQDTESRVKTTICRYVLF